MDFLPWNHRRRRSVSSGVNQKWRAEGNSRYGIKEKENVPTSFQEDIPTGQFGPDLSQLTGSSESASLSFQQKIGPPCHQPSASSSNHSRGSTMRYSAEPSFRGGNPSRNNPTTISEPNDSRRSTSSVSIHPPSHLNLGPAQQLLKRNLMRFSTKSHSHSRSTSSKQMVSSKVKFGATPSVKNAVVRSHSKKKRNETSISGFSTNGNRNPAIQSVGVTQEQDFFRFRSDLERICAERVRISEQKMEERARISEQKMEEKFRSRIEEVQGRIESRVEENEDNLRATKHDLEEELKSYSNESKSREIVVDKKIAELNDDAAFHTRGLKQAAESHIREINETGSSQLESIRNATEPFFKKYEECKAWVLNKVMGSGLTSLNAPPSQSQPAIFQTSEIQPNSKNQPSSNDEPDDSLKVANATVKLDAPSRPPTRESECHIATTNSDKRTSEKLEDSRNLCHTRQSKSRQRLKRSARNGPALDDNTPSPHRKKACVTPSQGNLKWNGPQKESPSAPTPREGSVGRSHDPVQRLSSGGKDSRCHQEADFVPTTIDRPNRGRKRARPSIAVVDEVREDFGNGGLEEEAFSPRGQAKPSPAKHTSGKKASSRKKDRTPPLHPNGPFVTPSRKQVERSATPMNRNAAKMDPKLSTTKRLCTGKIEAKAESLSSGTDKLSDGVPKLIITDPEHEFCSPLSSSPVSSRNKAKKSLWSSAGGSKQTSSRRNRNRVRKTYGKRGNTFRPQMDDVFRATF